MKRIFLIGVLTLSAMLTASCDDKFKRPAPPPPTPQTDSVPRAQPDPLPRPQAPGASGVR